MEDVLRVKAPNSRNKVKVGEEGPSVSATLLWPLRDASSFMVVIFKVCSHLVFGILVLSPLTPC